ACRTRALPTFPTRRSSDLVVDYVGDAPNNYPGGDGSNIDNLDVVNAFFGTPSSSDLQVTMTIKDLMAPPPPVNLVSAFWTVYWRSEEHTSELQSPYDLVCR